MNIYTVHLRQKDGSQAESNLADLDVRFVAEQFNWWALIVPVVWAVFAGLWLAALGLLGVTLLLGLVTADLHPMAQLATQVGFGVLVGFEAPAIRRLTLRTMGYRDYGVVAANDLLEAEYRFFEDYQASRAAAEPQPGPWGALA